MKTEASGRDGGPSIYDDSSSNAALQFSHGQSLHATSWPPYPNCFIRRRYLRSPRPRDKLRSVSPVVPCIEAQPKTVRISASTSRSTVKVYLPKHLARPDFVITTEESVMRGGDGLHDHRAAGSPLDS